MTTAVSRFIANDAAQIELESLVSELFSIALENGQAPSDWSDISDASSLDESLKKFGFGEEYKEDDELREYVDDLLEQITTTEYQSRITSIRARIYNSKNLDELKLALEAADDHVRAYRGSLFIGDIYEPANIPTFGGEMPEAEGIFSYDEKRVLYGVGGWFIEDRDAETGAMIHQEDGGFEIDGVSYKFESRHYLGRDQIDTIRFSRWEPQDAVSSVRAGVVDIDAFERDTVLLSEMIERVKAAEDAADYGDDE
jgi:hypothetical protein